MGGCERRYECKELQCTDACALRYRQTARWGVTTNIRPIHMSAGSYFAVANFGESGNRVVDKTIRSVMQSSPLSFTKPTPILFQYHSVATLIHFGARFHVLYGVVHFEHRRVRVFDPVLPGNTGHTTTTVHRYNSAKLSVDTPSVDYGCTDWACIRGIQSAQSGFFLK
jgi:hypothetical protein